MKRHTVSVRKHGGGWQEVRGEDEEEYREEGFLSSDEKLSLKQTEVSSHSSSKMFHLKMKEKQFKT